MKYWTATVTLELSGTLYGDTINEGEETLTAINECRAHGYMVDSHVCFEEASPEEE